MKKYSFGEERQQGNGEGTWKMLRKKLLTKNKINQPAQTFLLSLSKLFSDLNLICFTKASKNSMTCENKQNTSSEMLWLGLN